MINSPNHRILMILQKNNPTRIISSQTWHCSMQELSVCIHSRLSDHKITFDQALYYLGLNIISSNLQGNVQVVCEACMIVFSLRST